MWQRTFWIVVLALGSVPASFSWDAAPPPWFPQEGLLPKSETGALRFLQEHPEYDGRGVLVAIFDTGVDPGAPGLQTTPTGAPKIVDLIDATGSGDVPTSEVQELQDGHLAGLTGRKLKVDAQWKNPTGKYHLGMKAAYELFPPDLIPRLKRERKEQFEIHQRALESSLREQLARIESGSDKSISKAECEARLAVLTSAWERYEDPGPVYDCVVFHDGTTFRAVIDTDEDGDLTNEKALANYRLEREYASFGEDSRLNFSVNIHDQGNLLSIVTTCDEHGTHVAGIVAAWDAQRPERNGLAPGAQLVSVKIGDTRMNGMETGAALIRGLQAVLDHRCDLINMSYGEPTSTPDQGALVERFNELVREKNVIFVAAAGNNGPALSTVGAPGGTTSAVIGVGAYVSPAMMAAEYTLRDIGPGLAYTWTSRGPTTDGDWGVDIFAPGGAIAPIPNYALQPGRQMNGTSMASPNACGNIALLLSGLKQQKLSYSPTSILRSLQATAQRVETADLFAQGPGLLQVDRAYEDHLKWQDAPGQEIEIEVSVPGRRNARGIYLREPYDANHVFEGSVHLQPRFPRQGTNSLKLGYQLSLEVTVDVDWVEAGRFLLLAKDGSSIPIRVDPTKLPPGVHTAQIEGRDAESPGRGPLFRVPIVVTRPHVPESGLWKTTLASEAGSIARNFLEVPHGARYATVRIRRQSGSGQRQFFLHAVQLAPGRSFEELETHLPFNLVADELFEKSFPVESGRTLELCLAQYWSSPGHTDLDVEVRFHGLATSMQRVWLPGDGAPVSLDVSSRIEVEQCTPRARLTTWDRLLSPESTKRHTLGAERDSLWDNLRMQQLILTYSFEQSRKNDVSLVCETFKGLLYDSPLDSFRMFLFDEHQQLIRADGTEPEQFSLEKGHYKVEVELRHTDREVLEQYTALTLAVRQALSSPIAVPIDRSRPASVMEQNEFERQELSPGERTSLFLRFPRDAELPDDILSGDQLSGELFLTGVREGPIPLIHSYISGSAGEHDDSPSAAPAEEQGKFDLQHAQLNFWLKSLKSLTWPQDQASIEQLSALILKQDPQNRDVRVARLHLLDTDDREERLPEIVNAANDVIQMVNQKQLRAYFGQRHDPHSPAEKKQAQERAAEKRDLVDALYRKGRALAYMELPEVVEKHPLKNPKAHDQEFDKTCRQLARWVDLHEREYFLLQVRRDRRTGNQGQALKLLHQFIDKDPDNQKFLEKRQELYEELGWESWSANQQHWLWRKFPKSAVPF